MVSTKTKRLLDRNTRRDVLKGVAGASGALAASSRLGDILTARAAPALVQGSTSMTYWGVITFSQVIDDLQKQVIQEWGDQNGFDIDVIMVNGNEMIQRVSAGVESGTMPDALDMSLDIALLLSQTDQLAPLEDVYDRVGAEHGGWIESAAAASRPDIFGGNRVALPYGTIGNLLFRRQDLLSEAGFEGAPQTWDELKASAIATTNPPVYGMGFALSNVGDGNLQAQILQSWGGRIADDTGTTCTIKSQESRDYLEWVADAFEQGAFPPGVAVWDGAGDNNAYQSGQVVYIANPGSVYVWMKDNDPELAEGTQYSAMPAGPVMQISPAGVNARVIPAGGENIDAAKELLAHLANRDFMSAYYADGVFGPVLQEQLEFEAFSANPVHAGLADLALKGTLPAYPDVSNAAYADFMANFVVPKMVQRVVIDGYSLDDALDEAQRQGDAIYAKYD